MPIRRVGPFLLAACLACGGSPPGGARFGDEAPYDEPQDYASEFDDAEDEPEAEPDDDDPDATPESGGLEESPPWDGADLDCADIGEPVAVNDDDPHGLDRDGDGVGCETW